MYFGIRELVHTHVTEIDNKEIVTYRCSVLAIKELVAKNTQNIYLCKEVIKYCPMAFRGFSDVIKNNKELVQLFLDRRPIDLLKFDQKFWTMPIIYRAILKRPQLFPKIPEEIVNDQLILLFLEGVDYKNKTEFFLKKCPQFQVYETLDRMLEFHTMSIASSKEGRKIKLFKDIQFCFAKV